VQKSESRFGKTISKFSLHVSLKQAEQQVELESIQRNDFPILTTTPYDGKKLIYLD
jgi:hypothetical protein